MRPPNFIIDRDELKTNLDLLSVLADLEIFTPIVDRIIAGHIFNDIFSEDQIIDDVSFQLSLCDTQIIRNTLNSNETRNKFAQFLTRIIPASKVSYFPYRHMPSE